MNLKCEDLDNLIILALLLTVIGDALALFAELISQRCDEKEEQEKQERESTVNAELNDLRKRVALLEKQAGLC